MISCAGEVPPTTVPEIVIASAAVYPDPPAFICTEVTTPEDDLTTSNVAPVPVPPVDATPVKVPASFDVNVRFTLAVCKGFADRVI